MSLHDVDKSGFQRDNPSPNSHDDIGMAPRMSHGTNSANYQTGASDIDNSDAIRTGFNRYISSFISLVSWAGANNTTTSTIPHGLPYTPIVQAFINNASFSGAVSLSGVSYPLPAVIDWDTSTTPLSIKTFMWILVDDTNIYVITANGANGSAGSLFITFYLSQQRAQ